MSAAAPKTGPREATERNDAAIEARRRAQLWNGIPAEVVPAGMSAALLMMSADPLDQGRVGSRCSSTHCAGMRAGHSFDGTGQRRGVTAITYPATPSAKLWSPRPTCRRRFHRRPATTPAL